MADEYFKTAKIVPGLYRPVTLTVHLGKFLSNIEALFGPRDSSFTILGIEIVSTQGEVPHISFPPSHEARKHVIVRLGPGSLREERWARWQLAHECVHLLDPRIGNTSVLEEGLAAWYQNQAVTRKYAPPTGKYADAEQLVLPLMDRLPAAIKQIRQQEGRRLGEISAELLQQYCPELPIEATRRLAQQFDDEAAWR